MPREVIAIDADPGNPGSVHQLSSAIDLARLECGVHIHIDLDPVRAFAAEPGGPAYARRSVALGVMKRGTDWGLLWYGKPVLSKDSPTPLLAHREIDAEFPHTTTVDQFFDTSHSYVAYQEPRSLQRPGDQARPDGAQGCPCRARLRRSGPR